MFGGRIRQTEDGYNCSFCKYRDPYLSVACTHIVRNHTYTIKTSVSSTGEQLRYFPNKESLMLAQELIDPAGITQFKSVATEPGWYVWYSDYSRRGVPLAEYLTNTESSDANEVRRAIKVAESQA